MVLSVLGGGGGCHGSDDVILESHYVFNFAL